MYCREASEFKSLADLGLSDTCLSEFLDNIEELILKTRVYICEANLTKENAITDLSRLSNFLWGTMSSKNHSKDDLHMVIKTMFEHQLIREELSLTDRIIRRLTNESCNLYWELFFSGITNDAATMNKRYEMVKPVSSEEFYAILFHLCSNLSEMKYGVVRDLLMAENADEIYKNPHNYQIYHSALTSIINNEVLVAQIDGILGGVFTPALFLTQAL